MDVNAPGLPAIRGRTLVAGEASGELLYTDTPISFMGGVDPLSGVVIDAHHPLRGRSIARRILAIPSGRGSCASPPRSTRASRASNGRSWSEQRRASGKRVPQRRVVRSH